jgi:hypothetical protein
MRTRVKEVISAVTVANIIESPRLGGGGTGLDCLAVNQDLD